MIPRYSVKKLGLLVIVAGFGIWFFATIMLRSSVEASLETGSYDHLRTFAENDVDYDVHAFYYVWYGNPKFDNFYYHWSHRILPHWNPLLAVKWPLGRRKAPDDIGSNYYPSLGCYSSRDPFVVAQHMTWMRQAGIGTVVVSWYPQNESDAEGLPSDSIIPAVLDEAEKQKLKVAFMIEPYKERNGNSLRSNFEYIIIKYGGHVAFYRYGGKPVFYVYDSYLVAKDEWRSLLKANGELSIRATKYDSIVLALIVKQGDEHDLLTCGFDGFFTYFASTGFTYASTTSNWHNLASFAHQNRLLASFSVGPGYIDERIRPWNSVNTRDRANGSYYESMWNSALQVDSGFISITSFNEWHEGTQIEPASPFTGPNFTYLSYVPMESNFYLSLTRRMIERKNGPQRWKV
ncbi:hypothetical protein M513_05778 [Trichuris suis]|uniref:Glycosyl hydrolase family 71 n=2 Tax=Trichuris suis TaxID=68888 RepID=A0A085M7V1_9BILA|nr:hypothetical protein M513_05778 [Trichuris suis]